MLNENKSTFSFEVALVFLKSGHRLARKGWNGKGMWVYLVPGSTFEVDREPLASFLPEGVTAIYRPHIDMRAADGSFGVWLASQTDILATDWYLVNDDEITDYDPDQIDESDEFMVVH